MKPQATSYSELSTTAFHMIETGQEWTEIGITTALIQRLRDQGSRITERVRETCQAAAATAIGLNREKQQALAKGLKFVNPLEVFK